MKILGLDPGFASLGWGLISSKGPQVLAAGVIRTKPGKERRKCDDNAERCRFIANALADIHERHYFALIAAEAQSWTRHATGDRAVAMAWGIIVATAARFDVPILQIRPQEAKREIAGSESASKAEIQATIEAMGIGAKEHLSSFPTTQQNHAFDALAVALASLSSPLVKTAQRMRGN
jgi:crossover junction endodeoxyribonuclease RuvC